MFENIRMKRKIAIPERIEINARFFSWKTVS